MPPKQALNLAWHYLTKDGTKQSIDRIKADLLRPLPGHSEEVSDEVVAAELAMFAGSMAKNQSAKK